MPQNQNKKSRSDELMTRSEVAERWSVSVETIKRREKDGSLTPVYLPGGRLVRYRLSEIIKQEGGSHE